MSGPRRPFHPSELRLPGEPDPTVAELADLLSAARDLEALAAGDGIRPTDGFEDRVMAAIAAEPAPRVVVRPANTVRGGWPGAFVLAIRDAWGVATTGGRPFAVRAQALALVLVVVLAASALTAAGAATVGGLLDRASGPNPSLAPAPTPLPTTSRSETPTPTETTGPSESTEPSDSSEPTETAEPGGTAEPEPNETPGSSRDPGGSGGGGDDGGGVIDNGPGGSSSG